MMLVFSGSDFGLVFLFPLAKVFVRLKSSSNMQQIKQQKKKKTLLNVAVWLTDYFPKCKIVCIDRICYCDFF